MDRLSFFFSFEFSYLKSAQGGPSGPGGREVDSDWHQTLLQSSVPLCRIVLRGVEWRAALAHSKRRPRVVPLYAEPRSFFGWGALIGACMWKRLAFLMALIALLLLLAKGLRGVPKPWATIAPKQATPSTGTGYTPVWLIHGRFRDLE